MKPVTTEMFNHHSWGGVKRVNGPISAKFSENTELPQMLTVKMDWCGNAP